MTEDHHRALSSNRKKRAVTRASITRLRSRLTELEVSPEAGNLDSARLLASRLQALDAEYKVHHYAIINHLDDEPALQREQEVLDEHDDEMAQLDVRVEKLITTCSSADSSQPKIASNRLKHLEKGLASINEAIPSLH